MKNQIKSNRINLLKKNDEVNINTEINIKLPVISNLKQQIKYQSPEKETKFIYTNLLNKDSTGKIENFQNKSNISLSLTSTNSSIRIHSKLIKTNKNNTNNNINQLNAQNVDILQERLNILSTIKNENCIDLKNDKLNNNSNCNLKKKTSIYSRYYHSTIFSQKKDNTSSILNLSISNKSIDNSSDESIVNEINDDKQKCIRNNAIKENKLPIFIPPNTDDLMKPTLRGLQIEKLPFRYMNNFSKRSKNKTNHLKMIEQSNSAVTNKNTVILKDKNKIKNKDIDIYSSESYTSESSNNEINQYDTTFKSPDDFENCIEKSKYKYIKDIYSKPRNTVLLANTKDKTEIDLKIAYASNTKKKTGSF